ncbi:NADH-quinone oxidoreductase subunit L [Algoriella xinjiangensis]|uniref:NADH-quinone oxidoreductase subunit L n=1 Tax=Algoriella xinjiangensis TaxID=684065 RepID=A0A1I4XK43_9FLAO|nr:NADH-quinone oxidoreductase subunit L [Algoriella xinjiangensis]SFN26298.1 NADH-quinone oxidoreductase subunit L [Algoriella xinjiangensis]VDH17686.1 NADH-quinone oxidoreductase subunit L [Algoriella xinjiangensis]
MEQYIWLIPLIPFIGFLINGLGRNVLSNSLVTFIGSGAVLASFILSIMVFIAVPSGAGAQPLIFKAFDLINIPTLQVPFAFQIDALTSLFLLIITGVGFLIHVYSSAYMSEDKGFAKFFAYLNLFIFFMLILVMGNNFVMMFIGWEGVGLCSFLLIGFWFTNPEYVKAAKKAFIMNRIGDVGFLLAMFWIFKEFGTLEYVKVFNQLAIDPSAFTGFVLTGITLLLFLAATGKSAQLPLFTWLPDAMAGPTPVSALIHAATMVTAGIFMIARCNVLFTAAPFTLEIIQYVGIATAFITATIAMRQNDIKKVLAYSTVSQLGLMFAAIGSGAYIAAVFHVMTHAFFKALLFLGAGSVIHGMHHEQDMRKMGGLKKYMKITHITFLIGCLAIAGIPGLSGFFSKDEMLLGMFISNPIIYVLGFIVSVLTAFYMFRLYAMTFLGDLRDKDAHPHESPAAMTIPLIILAVLSVVAGYIGIPALFMKDGHQLQTFLSGVVNIGEVHHVAHSTEWLMMGALLICVVGAILFAIKKYTNHVDEEATGVAKFFQNKWYIDELYDNAIVKPLYELADVLKKYVEKAGIAAFVLGVGTVSERASKNVRTLQNGNVGFYIMLMVVGIVAGIAIFFMGYLISK